MNQPQKPVLSFDLHAIDKKMGEVSVFIRESGFNLLFPVKSFPHEKVLSLAAGHLDGFDISNQAEYNIIKKHLLPHHDIWLSGPAPYIDPLLTDKVTAVAIQSKFSLERLKDFDSDQICYRLDSNKILNDIRQSRFGWSLRDLNVSKKVSFSIHHGMLDTKVSDLLTIFQEVSNYCLSKNLDLKQFNFGGGWGQFSLDEVKNLVKEIKTIMANKNLKTKILFEPGRWWVEEFGVAKAQILDLRPFTHGWDITLNISGECHLRWSRPKILLPLEWTQSTHKLLRFWGPTCSENDLISEVRGNLPNQITTHQILMTGISGYSVAWNHSFNGIENAQVEFNENK